MNLDEQFLKKIRNTRLIEQVNENVSTLFVLTNFKKGEFLLAFFFLFKNKSNEQFKVNYTINKHTVNRFKVVADEDMRKMSNIVENLIRRYVESRV